MRLTLVRDVFCIGLMAMMTACGGGGGSAAVDASPAIRVSGTAVQPESLTQTAKQALVGTAHYRHTIRQEKSAECPVVPDGYQPAVQARVDLIDSNGLVVDSTTADSCGAFTLNASASTQMIRVTSAGHQAIEVPVNSATDNSVLSALPDGARYEIAALQFVGVDRLSALIVDSVTKKAVLGLSPDAVSVQVAGVALPVSGIRSRGTASNAQPYSVTLVLDSSGSMTTCAANCVGDPGYSRADPGYTRYQLVARASHAFLDGKKDADETSLLAFSSRVYRLDNDQFSDALNDAAGASVGYEISADGFTSNAALLRLPVDYYNRYSAFWRNSGDVLHPITAASGLLPLRRTYPFSGGTALYTAVVDGLNWISGRANQRRIVIAMTDGLNNAGSETLETAIAKAQSLNVPVYTIGYGLDANRSSEARAIESLRSLANQTGAENSIVNGTDIVGLFAGLQTAIRFETEVQLGQAPATGQLVKLLVANSGGDPTTRDVTVPDLNSIM